MQSRFGLYHIPCQPTAQREQKQAKPAQKEYPGLPVVCAGGVMSSDIIRTWVQQRLPQVDVYKRQQLPCHQHGLWHQLPQKPVRGLYPDRAVAAAGYRLGG